MWERAYCPRYVGTGLVPVRSMDKHKGCPYPAAIQGQETFPLKKNLTFYRKYVTIRGQVLGRWSVVFGL